MGDDGRVREATAIMRAFCARTGLDAASGATPTPGREHRAAGRGTRDGASARRYLWTDAFAVCNLLGLARDTGDAGLLDTALGLVDEVHRVLGRERPDSGRHGWISGLDEAEGERHPTEGGLRIGKPLPERAPGEPFDESLEWERDGQYFHYLSKWMLALDRAACTTGRPVLNAWGRELASAAMRGFVVPTGPGGRPRLAWKMSIDLSRPLVPSTGQHDPLDGFLACERLRATEARLASIPGAETPPPPPEGGAPDLARESELLLGMIDRRSLATGDPLGIGGLLCAATELSQLVAEGAVADDGLLDHLLASAEAGLSHWERQGDLRRPARARLGFRELGLAIGLSGIDVAANALLGGHARLRPRSAAPSLLEACARHGRLADEIVGFWIAPPGRTASRWTDHLDIDEVMLATALAPGGFLLARPPSRTPEAAALSAAGAA